MGDDEQPMVSVSLNVSLKAVTHQAHCKKSKPEIPIFLDPNLLWFCGKFFLKKQTVKKIKTVSSDDELFVMFLSSKRKQHILGSSNSQEKAAAGRAS